MFNVNRCSKCGFSFALGYCEAAWRQQPGTSAYCTELAADELKAALHAVDRSRAPGNRDTLIKYFMEQCDKLTHDAMIARNREVAA